MSEAIRRAILELTTVILAAVLVFAPLFMAGHTQHSRHPPKYTVSGQTASSQTAPIDVDFRGVKLISEQDCYRNENVGECAARIVQERVAWFYFWLIALGAVQAVVGILTWQLLRKQTIIQHRQAETLPRIERAYVRVTISENGIRIIPLGLHGNVSIERSTLRLKVENSGKTPAEITRIAWSAELAPKAKDPKEESIIEAIDPQEIGGRPIPPGIESAPNDPYLGESENFVGRFLGIEHEKIANDTHALWVRGFVRYRDVFGGNHIVGFCYAFDEARNVFVSRGDRRYNYKRTEEENEIPPAAPWPPP